MNNSVNETTNRIIGTIVFQFYSTNHKDDGDTVKTPENDPLKTGIIYSDKQYETLNHKGSATKFKSQIKLL